MNCKEARLLIAGISGDELPEALTAHVRDCRDCADLLALDERLRTTLRRRSPALSPYMLGRIRQEVAVPVPARLSWFEDLIGKLMKIALPTTAVIAFALAVLPRTATAADPLQTFDKMKKAVLSTAKKMSPDQAKKVGTVPTWVLVDDVLTQITTPIDSLIEAKGQKLRFSPSKGDRSGLKKEMDGTIQVIRVGDSERVVQKNKETGDTTIRYFDGVKRYIRVNGRLQGIRLSLDATKYRSIVYGANHHQLVLTPKEKGQRYVVLLDMHSRLPKNIRLQRPTPSGWSTSRSSNVAF
ncbi:hypothetical protein EON79_02475 [bacterium]|nr:MAG: hypothetical protein EON79_02475 [bacterium]